MKNNRRNFIILILFLITALSACSRNEEELKNGYYSAVMAAFDSNGWKEYITVYVSSNRIVTIEYDAINASGFIKSWDTEYMSVMNAKCGTYPNEYTRNYAVSLLNWQDPSQVDAITGATHSHKTFQLLAEAAINQSKAGNKQVVLVELTEEAEHE